MTTRWEYNPETRTIVNPDVPGEPTIIARDVDPRDGPLLAAAPALARFVRAAERDLNRKRLDDARLFDTICRLIDLVDAKGD